MKSINGTKRADTLIGTMVDDLIEGFGGNDVLTGMGGNDTIRGGTGDDTIDGGDGNDYLHGGVGADSIFGGAGRDRLHGGIGNDSLDGGDGIDTAVFTGARSDYTFEVLTGGMVRITDHRSGSVNTGVDTMIAIENIKFSDGTFALQDVLPPPPSGATEGDDTLNGTTGNDVIDGLDGNDVINGGSGNDIIDGGAGQDILVGGAGDDTLYASNDDLGVEGQTGYDTAYFGSYFGLPGTKVVGVEHVIGGDGADVLDFGQSYGVVEDTGFTEQGGLSTSAVKVGMTIDGMGDIDVIIGTVYDDVLNGGAGGDNLFGNSGDDVINGGDGDDYLEGGEGNDIFVNSAGIDFSIGGAGQDIYQFRDAASGLDAISFVDGEDRIDLSGRGLTFADIAVSYSDTYRGVLLSIGAQSIVLDPSTMSVANVTADDFIF
ncbi:MAG: calcium-binding protein [Hyphomicrobiaceae bacterium]